MLSLKTAFSFQYCSVLTIYIIYASYIIIQHQLNNIQLKNADVGLHKKTATRMEWTGVWWWL